LKESSSQESASPIRLKEFLSPFIAGGFLSFVRLFCGLLRAKFGSVLLGPKGIGFIAQGNQFQLVGNTIGSMGLSTALSNRLLSSEKAPDQAQLALGTAVIAQLVATALFSAVIWIFRDFFALHLFGNTVHSLELCLVLLSVPFAVLATGYGEAVLYGTGNYQRYVIASTFATLAGAISFIILIRMYGMIGAFVAFPISAFFLCAFLCLQAKKFFPWRREHWRLFNWQEFVELFRVSITFVVGGLIGTGALLLIRSRVINIYGAAANGILQAALAMTAYYTPLLTNGLWGRLRTLSGKFGETDIVWEDLFRSLRFISVCQAGVALILLTVPAFFLKTIYSYEFVSAETLLSIQLFGDSFNLLTYTFGIYFMSAGKIRTYFLGNCLHPVVQLVIVLLFLPTTGVWIIPVSYTIASIVTLIVFSLLLFRKSKHSGVWLKKENWIIPICISAVALQSTLMLLGFGVATRAFVLTVGLVFVAHRQRELISRTLKRR